jgi:hypothetical protein
MANSVIWQDTPAAIFKNTSAAVWRKHGILDTISEGIEFAEVASPWAALAVIIADGIKFSDTPSALAILLATAIDGIEFSDTTLAAFTETLTDGFEFSDTAISAFVENLSDGIEFSDSVVDYFTELVQDGIKFSDTAPALAKMLVEAIDGIVFSDTTPTPRSTFQGVSADGVKFSDTATSIGKFGVTITDGIVFSDALAAGMHLFITLSDGMVFDDTTVGIAVESLSDGLIFSDVTVPLMTYRPVLTDTVVFDDLKTDYFKNCELQDYTTYTLVPDALDDRGDILIEGPQVIGLRRDSGGDAVRRANYDYIYKDFGAGYFGDFRCDLAAELTQISDFGGGYNMFAASNILGSFSNLTDRVGIYIDGNWQYNIIWAFGPGSSMAFRPARGDAYGLNYFIRFERRGYDLTVGIYTDDSFSTLRNDYFGGTPMEGTITIDTADRYQYFYAAGGFNTGYGLYPTVLGEAVGHTICEPQPTTYALITAYATSTDGIKFSEAPMTPRVLIHGDCSDAIVFNDTATVRVDFGIELEDGFKFSEHQQVAWPVELEQGIRFGDSVIWIRPYDKDEIDVQPKGLDYTFKALAKITNFTAFKKQFATDAFDLSIPIAINIHPQETDFKALSKPFDFKAQPKDFNTEV